MLKFQLTTWLSQVVIKISRASTLTKPLQLSISGKCPTSWVAPENRACNHLQQAALFKKAALIQLIFPKQQLILTSHLQCSWVLASARLKAMLWFHSTLVCLLLNIFIQSEPPPFSGHVLCYWQVLNTSVVNIKEVFLESHYFFSPYIFFNELYVHLI